jgi:aminopeptidase N
MKKLLLLTFLFFPLFISAQESDSDLPSIIESETKSALNSIQGSRNLNTGNYDLKYHRLEWTVDPNVAFISGDVTSHFVAKENLNEVIFDLSGNMVVSEILQRGNALSFIQNADDEVVITLPQVQNLGVLDSLTIRYSGNPISSGFGSFEQTTHNGDPIIWTLSEPFGAKGWWPCKQDLNDKIDVIDVYITSPQFNASNEEYMAASNGLELSQVVNGSSKTTHFKHQYPIPAYLIAMAVTNYEIYSHPVANNGNPFDVVNYVYPEDLASWQANTGVTVDIMNLFTDLFEEYPYADEKYGHAQFGWGGGMEHTTVSFMGSYSRGLIAHELAHQWFGDKITCGSWKDIWLNEGFATYLSALVIENLDGDSAFKSWRSGKISSITSSPDGVVYIPDNDTTNVGRVFSSRLSYNKPSMVLHMLRKKVGDANFYQGMQDYLGDTNFAYGYAKTPDFIAKMEDASGEDLTEFFDDWIYNEGYPSYAVSWSQNAAYQVSVTLNQSQSHASVSYFEAPVSLRFFGTNNEELDVSLDNTVNGENFLVDTTFPVALVVFDPDKHLISKNNSVVLGVNDNDLSTEFFVFPNPVLRELQIKKPNDVTIYSIEILDVLGRTIMTPNIRESINVEHLPSGLHFVRFETSAGIVTRTIIKK